jgi:hypothetical protein
VHLTVTELGIAMFAPGTVRDCAIFMRDLEGPVPEGFLAYDSGAVTLDGCSIFALNGYGVGVSVSDGSGQSSLTATGLVMRGFFAPFSHGDGSEADVRYSDFDTEAMWTGTGGSLVVGPGVDYHEDPGWVDEDAGDLRLRADSPLIDRGDPAPGAPPWDLDVDLLDRSVDGDGDGGARIDIGAFEYQRRAPSVTLEGPAGGTAGQPLTFTAAGTDPDPGESPAFAWRVDGADTAEGPAFEHAFAEAGEHVVEVVATDPAGLTATASRTVTLGPAPPADPPATTPPGSNPPPVVLPPPSVRAVITLPRRATLRRGRIRVTLRCEGAPCAGTLTLRAGARRLGRKRFALATGQQREIRMRVSRRRARRLRRVQAAVRLLDGAVVTRRVLVRRGS